jgi:hypothetical protein
VRDVDPLAVGADRQPHRLGPHRRPIHLDEALPIKAQAGQGPAGPQAHQQLALVNRHLARGGADLQRHWRLQVALHHDEAILGEGSRPQPAQGVHHKGARPLPTPNQGREILRFRGGLGSLTPKRKEAHDKPQRDAKRHGRHRHGHRSEQAPSPLLPLDL